jgi:hypothetical protein
MISTHKALNTICLIVIKAEKNICQDLYQGGNPEGQMLRPL